MTKAEHTRLEQNRFKSISDFEDCMIRGGEVEFEWKEIVYGICHDVDSIAIYEANKQETEKKYSTSDEALESMLSGDRLRDVTTQVKVWARTL